MPAKKKSSGDVVTPSKKIPTQKASHTNTEESSSWYQRHASDTGSPEFQINLLSERIISLQEHLKTNHKDYDAKRTILRLVEQRRSHLKYLKSNNLERYQIVNRKTGLKI